MKKYGLMLLALLACGALYAAQDTALTQAEVRDPRRLETWLEGNASDAQTRLAAVEAGTSISLASNKLFIGNASGVANAKTISGVITTTTNGAVAFTDTDLDTWASITPGAAATNLVKLSTVAAMRTNLGLVVGTDVQAYDADLTTWAGITPHADGQALVAVNYATMRTNLSLRIGTDVQAYDADLTTWAGITPHADGQALVAVNYATMRTNLSLRIGTDVQAYDADLTTWAGITPHADGQALVAVNYATMRTNLSLVVGTDVLAPNGNGSALTALSAANITGYVKTDANPAEITVTTNTPAFTGQWLIGTVSNNVWLSKGVTTNDWVVIKAAP